MPELYSFTGILEWRQISVLSLSNTRVVGFFNITRIPECCSISRKVSKFNDGPWFLICPQSSRTILWFLNVTKILDYRQDSRMLILISNNTRIVEPFRDSRTLPKLQINVFICQYVLLSQLSTKTRNKRDNPDLSFSFVFI